MTIDKSNISDLDYSELIVQMQHTLSAVHKKIQKKRFAEARKAARDLAMDAMLVGIWCQQFLEGPVDKK